MTSFKRALTDSARAYRQTRFDGDLSSMVDPPAPRRLRWPVAIAASVLMVGLLTALRPPASTPATVERVASQPAAMPADSPRPPVTSIPFKLANLKRSLMRHGPDAPLSRTPSIKRMTSKRLAWSAFPSLKPQKEKTS